MKKNPKPKTQTLGAVVSKADGFIYEASASCIGASIASERFTNDREGVTVRRLTVPAFAPKRRKSK